MGLDTDRVGARVLVGHTFAVVFDAVAPIIVFKVVLQAMEGTGEIEIREPLHDDGHVHIVGLAGRLDLQEESGNKRPYDSKRDPQLPQSAFKVHDDRHQVRINAPFCCVSWRFPDRTSTRSASSAES